MHDAQRGEAVTDAFPSLPGGSASARPVDSLLDYQSACWSRSERQSVESILHARGASHDDADLVLDLIYHEVLLRQRYGETPRLDEYVARFPQLAAALRSQFEVHHALQPGTSLLSTIATPDARPAPTLPSLPNYDVLGELGRGGMGVVYKARHLGLKRLVALKMLRGEGSVSDSLTARFRSEAAAMARLEHPNIVRVYETAEFNGRPYFAMELVTGGSLERRLDGAPWPPQRSAQMLEILAQAVQVAHARQLVHRDLKPSNILLQMGHGDGSADGEDTEVGSDTPFPLPPSPFPIPKITDFGLAKRLDDADRDTRSGDILGTPCYMAPEQAYGRNNTVGPATDVWALGAILYEMLTGRPPFRGETVWDTLQQVGRQDPVPPRRLQPKVPRDLETICLKCLQKEPTRRYVSAAALADDLGSFLAGKAIRARPLPWWELAMRAIAKRPFLAGAVAFFVALMFAGWYAHEADTNSQLRQSKLDEAVADVRATLGQAELRAKDGNWQGADSLVRDGALDRLDRAREEFPDDPRLAELRSKAEDWSRLIGQKLTRQDLLTRLAEARADAGFFATPFAGLDVRTNRARTVAVVERALQPFVEAGALVNLEKLDYSSDEARSVREGYCELLLDRAAVTLEAAADESHDRQRENAREALTLIDRAGKAGVDTPVLSLRRAACLERLGRPDEARAARESATGDLHRPFEWFLRGTDLCRAGKVAQAAENFENALVAEPDHFAALYALAVCRIRLAATRPELRTADLAVAKSHLTLCISRKPDRVWPYIQRGLARGEVGDFVGSEADFAVAERLLTAAPDATALYGVLVNRGLERFRERKLDEAVADLRRATAVRPGEWQAYVNLAAAYTDKGQLAEAAAELDRAAALKPAQGLAAIHRHRGRLHQTAMELIAAADEFGRAAEAESSGNIPLRAGDYLERARLLQMAGRPAAAVTAADNCLRLQADNAGALRTRAEALLSLGRYADAVTALDRFLDAARDRADATVYRARASALIQLDNPAAAAEDYTRALGLQPDDPVALTARGWAYVVLDANALADRDFERTLRLTPESAAALLGRGYVRVKVGSSADGLRDAESALRIGPRKPELLYNAARVFARAARRSEGDPTRQNRASVEERVRLEGRAVDLLREALEATPADRQGKFWRAQIERDAALGSLRRTAAFRELAGTFAQPDPAATPR